MSLHYVPLQTFKCHCVLIYGLLTVFLGLQFYNMRFFYSNEISCRHKRDVYTKYDSGANVEFIHPKLQSEIVQEPTDPNNPWVWLTSYSRIPLEAIKEFCASTKEYCPPGKEGKPGVPGLIGEKGTHGKTGNPGNKGNIGQRGPTGPTGPRGSKGEHGIVGKSGFDGRDGLPGEPGIDGVPGRNGLDGLPGIDGIHGTPGTPGLPGNNGKDGIKGDKGSLGPNGLLGQKGLTGPRGRSGKDGFDGAPGKPGLSLWTVKGSTEDHILIPPYISGGSIITTKPIIVQEGDNLKLTCAAYGNPKPMISWNRNDGIAIPHGAWKISNSIGSVLNITRIHRQHMGDYQCEANNGIYPTATSVFYIHVYFPPLIRLHQQTIGGFLQSHITLECTIEAFPTAVNYWERYDGKIIQRLIDKYDIFANDINKYTTLFRLKIFLLDAKDLGTYYCNSKNEKGLTRGSVTIFERDPNLLLPTPVIGAFKPVVIGEEPPELAIWDDLCSSTINKCPDCTKYSNTKCSGSGRMFGLNIVPYLNHMPGLPNRRQDCVLETIGKPVFHHYSNDLYGSWLMDVGTHSKIWVTKSTLNQSLFEFENKTSFRENKPFKEYHLPFPFTGNDHVIYNESFYYLHKDSDSVVKYDLKNNVTLKMQIPKNYVVSSSKLPLLANLYGPQQMGNYLDFSVDENGIWGIFGLETDNHTVVFKIDEVSLNMQYMWNISLNHHQVADMFIVCGVLYGVDHVETKNTRIRFALDLYKNKLLDVELPFTNPFSFTTMLGYNPSFQSLVTWDGGNQLTYPVKYHDIGYREEIKDDSFTESATATGYQIKSKENIDLQIMDMSITQKKEG